MSLTKSPLKATNKPQRKETKIPAFDTSDLECTQASSSIRTSNSTFSPSQHRGTITIEISSRNQCNSTDRLQEVSSSRMAFNNSDRKHTTMERKKYFNYGIRPASRRTRSLRLRARKTKGRGRKRDLQVC